MSDPAAESADSPEFAAEPTDQPAAEAEPVIEETQRVVSLERSVRVGRVVIGTAIAGALIAALASIFFPIAEGAEYTLGQVMGFSLLVGGAIGLGLGGLFVLILAAIAKKQRGTGVAIQSDVR